MKLISYRLSIEKSIWWNPTRKFIKFINSKKILFHHVLAVSCHPPTWTSLGSVAPLSLEENSIIIKTVKTFFNFRLLGAKIRGSRLMRSVGLWEQQLNKIYISHISLLHLMFVSSLFTYWYHSVNAVVPNHCSADYWCSASLSQVFRNKTLTIGSQTVKWFSQ